MKAFLVVVVVAVLFVLAVRQDARERPALEAAAQRSLHRWVADVYPGQRVVTRRRNTESFDVIAPGVLPFVLDCNGHGCRLPEPGRGRQ